MILQVRSDNMTALHLVAKLKATSKANLIARELELDISNACFFPDVVAHSPGAVMLAADALSRKFKRASRAAVME